LLRRGASLAQASMVNKWLTIGTKVSAMRIDSGLSSYSYHSRFIPSATESEDASADSAATAKPRSSGNSAFSSTLLSSNLATALWIVEGGRKAAATPGADLSVAADETPAASVAEKVEALYREYELDGEEG
jgi:hypothetical protein